jgi:hypothetical protein
LRDLLGLVDAVNKDTVIIKARHEAIKDKLSFKLSEVEKYFDQVRSDDVTRLRHWVLGFAI